MFPSEPGPAKFQSSVLGTWRILAEPAARSHGRSDHLVSVFRKGGRIEDEDEDDDEDDLGDV